jgi:hypothetical protein
VSGIDVVAVVDVGAVVIVVVVAFVFLARRFSGTKAKAKTAAAPVVVGDALQRGLKKAQQKKKKKKKTG